MIADKYAKEQGFLGAEQIDIQFEGYDVFKPIFEQQNGLPPVIGIPIFYLVKGNFIREADLEESFQILDELKDLES